VIRSPMTFRFLVVALILGVVFVLPACGLLGENDDGDGEKFPEPPDRPSGSQIATPDDDAGAALATMGNTPASSPTQIAVPNT